jgi:beta-lactamase regulating signal transducer with metallopeptidase domain
MSEVLGLLLRLNLALGAAVALVLILRAPARRLFGATVAYGLWMLVPLAAAAMLAPARAVTVVRAIAAAPEVIPAAQPMAYLLEAPAGPNPWTLAAALWLAGGLISLGWLAWRQVQFSRARAEGRAGPAVIGVLRPRIVTPDDFEARYSPRERLVVLAHERTHIARQDSRVSALVALVRCINWFNPLVHLLAHYLRIDQELACDAQVVAAHPTARRAYAEAMLKTQLAARPLPLGCYWPAQALHPLAQRIALLSRKAPGRPIRLAGSAAIAALALAAGFATWAARPPQVEVRAAPVALAEGALSPGVLPAAARPAAPSSPATAAETPSRPTALAPPATPAEPVPPAAPAEPAPLAEAAAETPRLLTEGEFGPPRHVHAAARWSSVEPGSAVRVVATMTDPDGHPLTTDLTAFGSQSFYRLGYIQARDSRYKLFTSVVQNGDRFTVTAALNEGMAPPFAGLITLASGETGRITLPNGLVVTVTPTVRPETLEEVAQGRGRALVRVDRTFEGG